LSSPEKMGRVLADLYRLHLASGRGPAA